MRGYTVYGQAHSDETLIIGGYNLASALVIGSAPDSSLKYDHRVCPHGDQPSQHLLTFSQPPWHFRGILDIKNDRSEAVRRPNLAGEDIDEPSEAFVVDWYNLVHTMGNPPTSPNHPKWIKHDEKSPERLTRTDSSIEDDNVWI